MTVKSVSKLGYKPSSLFFLFLLSIVLLVACGPEIAYQKKSTFTNQEWTYADSIDFSFTIQDTSQLYHAYLEFEHSVEYPKQNLYVQIHAITPSQKRVSEQVSFDFANKLGRWLGDCDEERCTIKIPIHQYVTFAEIGIFSYRIKQYMRLDPLPEMNSIQFILEKAQKAN